MPWATTATRAAARAVAVGAFNARFGEMERVLWSLSLNSRAALLARENSPVLAALVWAIKSWWGVQGVGCWQEARTAGGYGGEPLAGDGSIATGIDDVSCMLQVHDQHPLTVPTGPRLAGECG
jgi:hypothetical protein